jgi:hypothetical protein
LPHIDYFGIWPGSTSFTVTAVLMERFYTNLWDKKLPKLEVLRQAQLAVLNDPGPRAQKTIQGFQARTFRSQYGSLGRARGLLVGNRHISQRCCNAVSEVNLPYSSTNPAGMVVWDWDKTWESRIGGKPSNKNP